MANIRMTLLASAVVALAGCQSTSEPTSIIQETNQAEQSVDVLVTEVRESYQEWYSLLQDSDSLSVYSPSHFRTLADAWLSASEVYEQIDQEPGLISDDYSLFSSKSYRQVYQENIEKVETSYQALQEFKTKADNILADAIAQMDYLDSIDTKTYFSSDYKKIDSDYRALFVEVRDDKLESAQDKQVKFLAKAKLLEVKVNHKIYIEPLEKEAAVLKKEGLSRVAPLTFERVEGEIKLAANVVSTNPRDKDAIEKAVARVQFELKHVGQVAHQVKLLAAVQDDKFESMVLDIENNLYAISQKIDGADYRDTMLREQAQSILASVKHLKAADKTDVLNSEIDSLNRKIAQLEAENKKQAEALAQADARAEQFNQQKARDDQYIKRMDELVASLKQMQTTPPVSDDTEADKSVSVSPVDNEQAEVDVEMSSEPEVSATDAG